MKSDVLAPKRSAIAASPMISPAFIPSIETPTTRRLSRSSTILITPRVSRMTPARGSPEMGNRGAQRAIHAHRSRLVYLNSSLLQANLLRLGAPPGGYQELFGGECVLAAVPLNRERDPLSFRAHPADLRSGDNPQT